MADKISIPIESKYDDKGAKAALRDAKELDKLKPEVKVTADTKKAVHDIDGLIKKTDKLDADTATILLTSNATKIAGDIADLLIDLDRLDAADPTVDVKATQINDLKGDLDTLEAKIREVNNIPVDIDTKPAKKGIDDVAASADSSKSVLANMVGNTTQDLGALGGIAGSAGVAIGQMGEYMADARAKGEGFGSILASFGKVALPIAGIGIGVQLITSYFANANKRAKELQEGVENINEALAEGNRLAAASEFEQLFRDELRSAQKAGINVRDATRYIQGLADEVPGLEGRLYRLGEAADLTGDGMSGLNHEALAQLDALEGVSGGLDKARSQFAANNLTYDEQQQLLSEVANALGGVATATGETAAANEGAGSAADAHNTILENLRDTLIEQADAARASVDADFALRDAARDAAKASEDYAAAVKESGGESVEAAAALDDATESHLALADAEVRSADEAYRAAGAQLTQAQKLDISNRSLLQQVATLEGPEKQALLDHIGRLNGIDPLIVSEIQALIDQGKMAEAETLLANTSKPRTAYVRAEATNVSQTEDALDALAEKQRIARINIVLRKEGLLDRGGWVGPDGAIAAERRPELVRLPGGITGLLTEPSLVPPGTQVTSGAETERILRQRELVGASSSVTNVTVNMPRGTRPDDVMRAADRYARRNGRSRARR